MAFLPEHSFIDAAREFFVSTTGDQTAKIQAALNAASLTGGRAIVVLPSGVLQVNSTGLTIPAGVTLKGQGPNATILEATVSGGTMCSFSDSYSRVTDLGITANTGITLATGVLLNASAPNEVLVDRLNIDNTVGGGTITTGINFSGSSGGYFNRISDCRLKGCTTGVSLSGTNALEAVLSNLNISGGTTGVSASGIPYFQMIHV
jgi:hypothetical protein